MKKLLSSLLLLVLLAAACVPVLEPTPERDGAEVIITLEPEQTLYSVTLSVLNAQSVDERCVVINTTDVGCVLGTLEAGTTTTVVVTGDPGTVYCSAFGFTDPDLGVGSYRLWPCKEGN
ncbi:MAG: hypothetical protein WDA03_10755 [Trueperaceae bacterium]